MAITHFKFLKTELSIKTLDKMIFLVEYCLNANILRVNSLLVTSVRPKFGIGRKYRPKLLVSVSVSEPKLFFSETETIFFSKNFIFFHVFLMYFCLLKEYKFLKT